MNTIISKIIGAHSILCALFHVFLPKVFKWDELAGKLPEYDAFINNANLNIMNYCMLLFWLFFAWAFIFTTRDVLETGLGKSLVAFLSIFWIIRIFVFQTVYVGFASEALPPVFFYGLGLVLSLVLLARVMMKKN